MRAMRTTERERTAFGERLFQARTHAKLTQKALAGLVGMSQSALGEAEITGNSTTCTAKIAEVCKVRAVWLEQGEGDMLEVDTEPSPIARTIASERVTHYLVGTPAGTDWRTIAMTLADALEESGTEVTLKQFLKLVDTTYRKLTG